eukprot:NODE_17_length_48642_cov_1.199349.p24 type:complete len:265 gc:universal NODE_17_length_48642_cov_1.199349:3760-4554(+)
MQLLLHGLQLPISPVHKNHPGYYKSYIFTGDPCTTTVPIQPSVLVFDTFNCTESNLFEHISSLNIVGTISNITEVPEHLNFYFMSSDDIQQVLEVVNQYSEMSRYPIIAITEPNHLWQLILIILLILLGISCILSGILHWYLYTPEEPQVRMLTDFQFNSFHRIDKTTYALSHDDKSVEENLCPICLDYLNIEIMTQLPCYHYYHSECIQYWLTKKSSLCPVCKHDCLDDVSEDKGFFRRIYEKWMAWRLPTEDEDEIEPLLNA